jgi:hypothetical protein
VVKNIRSLRIDRWCEMSLHRPELAERLDRAIRNGGDRNVSEKHVSEMMMRILAILDPQGPIRTKSVSVRPDGIGLMLAHQMSQKGPELQQIISMIQSGISTFWAEQQPDLSKNQPEMTHAVWQLQRVRGFLEVKSLGFGIERVLYELNP